MFRAGIFAPQLYEWNMGGLRLDERFFKNSKIHAGIEALEQIRARALRVAIGAYYQGLITIITPRHELEELSITLGSRRPLLPLCIMPACPGDTHYLAQAVFWNCIVCCILSRETRM